MPINALGRPIATTPDANLAAKQRYDADPNPEKVNLAIGSLADADGKPWSYATTYPTVLTQCIDGFNYNCGSYTAPSADVLAAAKGFVCDMLGIPDDVRPLTLISWATGGGSGALSRAIDFLRALDEGHTTHRALAVQPDSWPGYRAVAHAHDLRFCEAGDWLMRHHFLRIYQTVHNGTGYLQHINAWRELGLMAAKDDRPIIIDVPYAGFDYPHLPYDVAIAASNAPIRALIETGAPVVIAWGPTKVFNTFAYRPGGATVVICRTAEEHRNAAIRMKMIERGSTGFIDIATYALITAMANKPEGLCSDHSAILTRLAEVTLDWQSYAGGTPLAAYFTESYGGLFRIVPVEDGAIDRLAAQGIHVVDAGNNRIRINVIGLPESRAEEIVTAIAAEMRSL